MVESSTSLNDPSSSNALDNKDRVLRRGDLARIIGIKGKLKDNHKGDLTRIVRSIPINNDGSEGDQNGHPFMYDLELVLGGKLNGIPRYELQYTTAFEEGMTGDSRRQRKRKPTALFDEEENAGPTAKASSAAKKKKKSPTNSKSSAKASTSKSTTAKNANTKKRGKTSGNSSNGKKKSKNSTTAASETIKVATTNTGTGLGMFERHRREFERCLLRLQKLDIYNFFHEDDVPQEFDECYEPDSTPVSDENSATVNGGMDGNTSISPKSSATSSTSTDTTMSSSGENDKNEQKEESAIFFPKHPPYNFVVLRKRLDRGRYKRRMDAEENVKDPVGIHWEQFRDDVIGMCDSAIERNSGNYDDGTPGTLSHTTEKIKTTMEQIYEKTGRKQSKEMELSNDAHRFTNIIHGTENREAAMQGKGWRRKAFPERQYERLTTDAVCAGLSELDERIATYELRTSLKDSFLGLSYTYNDTGQSEGWMKTLCEGDDKNEQEKAAAALSSDDGVIKAQVAASMQALLIAVQDRVMTENGVLEQKELRSANWASGFKKVGEQVICTDHENSELSKPEIVEQPVWGMDCYTRKNISICLGKKFSNETVLIFIEKWLLPAINACPVDLAYNMSNAARILEGLPFDIETSLNQRKPTTSEQWSTTLLGKALLKKIKETSPPWLSAAARTLRKATESLGNDYFRIHPKGHGSIVLSPKIGPNRLVTFYRGEIYPSWRWGEKMDAISLIQERNNLKPRLPDFYNMALERPQSDPRGYGLLFVDASRKSGYGSMLSHSCNPSCEVRVAAVNGKLTLAMTTLRELTIGDEVTFDYNAVTESLHEYQAAVCLCGQGRCRGSFLHFATAECYQQVLNRNSPVAVRLSQLIKGSAKRVMADDDVTILKRHGFQTAAFGAVSVNRRKATNSAFEDASLDSMDFVPIWLRTHVADILRYIEYERRALPIALISNQITRDKKENGTSNKKSNGATKKESSQRDTAKSVDEKPVKGAKPEPTFFYFLRRKRESCISSLMEENKNGSMTGSEIEREIKKMASAEWKTFDDKTKQHWKEQAIAEWEKNGGKKKAALEQQRLKRLAKSKTTKGSKSVSKAKKSKDAEAQEASPEETQSDANKISFQAADAEGVSAMEQRIQQLTQALSRVGRVLDRHREERLRKQTIENPNNQSNTPAELRGLAHSPLKIMPNEHVVAWMWNHENGIVRTLLRMAEQEICVSPAIRLALKEIESKHSSLRDFGTPWEQHAQTNYPMTPAKGRQLLDEALLEFREALIEGIRTMATNIKDFRRTAKKREEKKQKRKADAEKIDKISTSSDAPSIRFAVKHILNDVIEKIEGVNSDTEPEDMEISEPWLNNYNKRFKMEKAADLLLMYKRTSTFFQLVPYESLQSTPIEVYAREVGNAVPRSIIEKKGDDEMAVELQSNDIAQAANNIDDIDDKGKPSKELKRTGLCDPEDIISEVVVDYQGDYVLSQLLQWYNAGIDQKPGLPDILGCAMLPSMEGCWTIDPTKGSNSSTGIRTKYQSNIRPKLVEWFKDPFKRGNPWTDDLRRGFVNKDDDQIDDASKQWCPIGSPVLDFLVTGDDHNLMDVLVQLGIDSSAAESNHSDGLLSSVDHGRPAQAVSNWVQCENPECQKWRKIPWHVDIDMLSEKFVCSDHIWGLDPPSCDAPEENWDESTDAYVEADGSVKPEKLSSLPTIEEDEDSETLCNPKDFKVGVRFDVLRPVKEKWSIANIVEMTSKRIKFHFVSTQAKNDVWLEKKSSRIAPLHTHTTKPKPKVQSQKVSRPSTSKSESKEMHDKQANTKDEVDGVEKPLRGNAKPKPKVKIEDEEESDGLSFADFDDEDSDDEVDSDGSSEKNNDGAISSHNKEKIEESPTVTDQSSSDGSHKRDFESSQTENSDYENECGKEIDQSSQGFTIPKKSNEATKKASIVVPKNVIPKKVQSSVTSGTSLISDAARQAMIEKKMAKKTSNHSKKSLSQNPSPRNDDRQVDKIHRTDHTSPSLKRKAFSDLSPSQGHYAMSSQSKKPSDSPSKNGNNQREMLSPRRSLSDKYSMDQRRERELYRDSTEYTVQGQSSSYEDSGRSRDFSIRNQPPNRSLNDRYSYEDRRDREIYRDSIESGGRESYDYQNPRDGRGNTFRSAPSSDHRRVSENLSTRTYDSYSQQDQYEADRGHSRYYDRSHQHESHTRYLERSSGYYDARYDQNNNEGFRGDGRNGSDRLSYQYDSRRYDDYSRRSEETASLYAPRSQENDYRREPRGMSERNIERDSHFYRGHNDYERPYSTNYDDNSYYRDDDRNSPRHRQESGDRREKKRKKKFDGSDEYSRRLESYSYNPGRNYSNEDRHSR